MQAFSCLMYHNVCANQSLSSPHGEWSELSPSIRSYFVEESAFEVQLASIQRSADLISLSQARNFFTSPVERKRRAPSVDLRPSTLLTFDDGWSGTLDLAVPVLRKFAAEATVFITTNLLSTRGFLHANELQHLPPQLQIGSHCRTHRFLNELPNDQIREELAKSKAELERLSGRLVDSVAIPNGAIDDRVRDIAHELGYALIFTSEAHINSLWTGPRSIGRAAIRSTTPCETVVNYALGEYGIEPIRQLVLSVPKQVLGPARYRKLRAWWMGELSTQKEMHDLCPDAPVYLTDQVTSLQDSAAETSCPF